MLAGVSSASLYPLETERAVKQLGELGVKNTEIFMNDFSEISGPIFDEILHTVRDYGINVVSLHPFTSPMESLFLFSDYPRRQQALIDIYKRYFECMNRLGARIFVLHGAILSAKCSDERYFEQFSRLLDAADEFGVTVAQENISYCKSGSLDFLKRLREQCGSRTKYVLDLKQARRSGLKPIEIIDALGKDVIHVHISDANGKSDCLPVGAGNEDFPAIIGKLKQLDYHGALLIELYRSNYGGYEELSDGVKKIEKMLRQA